MSLQAWLVSLSVRLSGFVYHVVADRGPILDVMAGAYNPSTWDVEAGGSSVESQSQLRRESETSLSYRRLCNECKQKKNRGERIKIFMGNHLKKKKQLFL